MVLSIVFCVLACVGLIMCALSNAEIKKLHIPLYPLCTLFFAILAIALGCIPFKDAVKSLWSGDAVSPIKILILFFSMTAISVFLDEAVFFKFLASFTASKAGKSQLKLFILLYVTVSVLTVFTSNDIVILTFTPFICCFCKNAKINPLPYLIEEFVAANTFSMALIIGNPTNIYLGLKFSQTFGRYLSVMILPSLVGGTVCFFVLFLLFKKQLKTPLCAEQESVTIEKPVVITGVTALIVCTLLLAFSDLINAEMWIVSLICFLVLFLTITVYKLIKRQPLKEIKGSLARLPYSLIPFLLSMFVLVAALDYNGVTQKLASFLKSDNIFVYGTLSTLCCNLFNNIPMSVLFASILQGSSLGAVYACVIGSNLGAYLTPIGALAGIMWLNILKKHEVKLSFLQFVKYGVIIALPTLFSSLATLWLVI